TDLFLSSGTWSLVGFESDQPVLGADALAARISNERIGDGRYRPLTNVIGLWLLEGTMKDFATRPTNDQEWAALITAAEKLPAPAALLDVIDPDVAIHFWNYDMVDWRPYVLESFLRPGRTVFGGSAAFFARTSDHMFLYKKAMRNISLMASEARRNRLAGSFITNWSKLTPVETSLVALAYGAHLAWSSDPDQEAFVEAFSRVWFGTAVHGMDRFFQLLSETTGRKKEAQNLFWSAPYNELSEGFMPDWLDRYDWSGKNFSVLLKHYTEQEISEAAENQMRRSLADAVAAAGILSEAAPRVTGHRTVFDLLRFSADSQHLKCRMGLALGEAVRLLKYPLPDEAPLRRAAAKELRAVLEEWARVKAVAAYFGIGYNDYYRDKQVWLYKVPYLEPPKSSGEEIILASIAPEAHVPYITAATLFLNGSNDHHGGHERGLESFKSFPKDVPWSFAIQARGHHDTEKIGHNTMLWMKKHVLGIELAWPAHPRSEIRLDNDGVPELVVTP
ncbi:MAG: hypothetical protein WCP53_16505, partial [Verrucomicrobiota bacterium]